MTSRPSGAIGRRVRLTATSDPYTSLRPGDEGVVTGVDDTGTVFVRWDSGSNLGLVPGEDHWIVVPRTITCWICQTILPASATKCPHCGNLRPGVPPKGAA